MTFLPVVVVLSCPVVFAAPAVDDPAVAGLIVALVSWNCPVVVVAVRPAAHSIAVAGAVDLVDAALVVALVSQVFLVVSIFPQAFPVDDSAYPSVCPAGPDANRPGQPNRAVVAQLLS